MASGTDMLLGAVGITLAGGAAALPIYVYATPDAFGPPVMTFARVGPAADVVRSSIEENMRRVASVDRAPLRLARSVDEIVTGTIPPAVPKRQDRQPQAYPFEVEPTLLFVSENRALVRNGGMLEVWKAGSRVGSDLRVLSIFASKAGGIVRLSNGQAFRLSRPSGPRK